MPGGAAQASPNVPMNSPFAPGSDHSSFGPRNDATATSDGPGGVSSSAAAPRLCDEHGVSRLHAYVFSDDDDDDAHAYEAWMREHRHVRNRPPDHKTWMATNGSCERALRERGNMQRVRFQLEGCYTPSNMRGAKEAKTGPRRTRYEQRHDRQFLRPPGGRVYRGVSFFTGWGIFDEAARLGKISICHAAETDKSQRRIYHRNTGVTPYHSNEALMAELPDDLDMAIFGSNCRSIAENGLKRGLGATEDWAAFGRVVHHLKGSRITQFVYEQVGSIVDDPQCADVLAHVLSAFADAGYAVKYSVVDPCNFGCGVSRPRALFLGMKEEAAALVGFLDQPVIASGPLGSHRVTNKCVADFLDQPRTETSDPDVVEFESWKREREATSDEVWEIRWFERYNSRVKRDAIRRAASVAKCQPITLGYAAIVGEKTVTYTGHKVGSIYGLLHGLTHSDIASGPGKNTAMYYDPKTGLVATLGKRIIQKMWSLEGLEGLTVQGMGQSAHPVPSTANFAVQTLFLDKYYAIIGSVPRVPRVAFRNIRDVLTGAGVNRIKRWVSEVEVWTQAKRDHPGARVPAVRPLVLGDEVTKFWARGWIFDLRGHGQGRAPERLERRGRCKHDIRLSNLPYMEDYDDPDVFAMDVNGFSTGSNPVRQLVLHCNTENFVEQEEHAIEGIEEEIQKGWLGVTDFIPFYPFQASNFFMIQQKEKWRRIYNLSKETRGRSVNQQRTVFVKAKLELVQHLWLREQLHRAAVLVARMRSWGWAVKVELFVVDLFKAYNQMCNDERELWFNGCHYVDRSGVLRFMTGERTGFGGENAPHGFGAKVTRATNHSVDAALDRAGDGYQLQAAYRRELTLRESETFEAPAMTVRRQRGCCALRGRDLIGEIQEEARKIKEAARRAEEETIAGEWYWTPLKRGQGLVAETPLMEPGPSVSKGRADKTYCVGTYLDDVFGTLIVFDDAKPGRRAHRGEEYTTNKADALSKYLKRARGSRLCEVKSAISRVEASKRSRGGRTKSLRNQGGEELRREYVRGTLEAGGMKVVCDAKSQKKYDGGACAEVQEILGLVYDTTDPTNPLTGLPAGKQDELRARLRVLEAETKDEVEHDEVESLAHKLSAAALATTRGRIYLGGFFEALRRKRGRRGTKILYTKWLRRNVEWWLAFFESGAPRMRILVPASVRRIETSIELFMEHPELIVLDGDTGTSA